MEGQTHHGGCLCGRFRYRIKGALLPIVHCHCAMCRKVSGAAVSSWTGASVENFHWQSEEPPQFFSSDQSSRGFCPQCGAQISFQDKTRSQTLYVTIGSLDDADGLERGYHIWTANRLPWVHIDSDLPKYEEGKVR